MKYLIDIDFKRSVGFLDEKEEKLTDALIKGKESTTENKQRERLQGYNIWTIQEEYSWYIT